MQARDSTVIVTPTAPMRRWTGIAVVTTLFGLVLGALGPFGSYLDDGILIRSAYWVGATWLGLFLYGGGLAISRRAGHLGSWRRWMLFGLSVLAASIPEAIATRTAAFLIWPGLHRYGPGWPLWYAQTTTIGTIAMLGATVLLDARSRRLPPPLIQAPATARPERRPAFPGIRPGPPPGEVLALQMEDHYVRVHTRTGSTLVQMPLSQAIEQIAATEGLRTHRSWWVARTAIAHIEGSPRSMRLHLVNGLSAPVARSAVAILRQAGWLEGKPGG